MARVALNQATSWWRFWSREVPEPPTPGYAADEAPIDAAIVHLIWALPRRQRQVVALRILLDQSVEETGRVEDACRKFLHHPADDPNFERMYNADQRGKISAWPDPATLPLVAQDQRGEVILAFFTDGRIYADCTIQQNGERSYGAIGMGEIEGERSGTLRVLGGMSAEGSSDGVPPLRSVIGDVAPEVASVTIERAEGEPVTATVRGGYFLAWWPSSAEIVRITAYDEDGNALATLEGTELR